MKKERAGRDRRRQGGPVLRLLGPEHAGDVRALELECFPSPWSLEQIVSALSAPRFVFAGLLSDDGLLAYVSVYHCLSEMEILNLAVRESARREGMGRRLLEFVLKTAGKMGIVKIFLEVRTSNIPARNLYTSAGFTTVGVRKGYYPDNGEDALVMRLNLGEPPDQPRDAPGRAARPA